MVDSSNYQTLDAITQFCQRLREFTQPGQLMQEAVHLVANLFGYPSVNIFLFSGKTPSLNFRAAVWNTVSPSSKDMAAFSQHIAAAPNIIQQAVQTKQIQVGHCPAYPTPPPMTGVEDELAAPLIIKEHVIGVIHLFSHTPKQLGQKDTYLLNIIAQQLASSVETIQLQTSLQRRIHEQKLLLESNAALGMSQEVDNALNLLAIKMTEALRAGACVISSWSEDDHTLTAISQHIKPHKDNPSLIWRTLQKTIPLSQDPIGRQVLQTLRPIAVRSQQLSASAPKTPNWAKHGWHSLLAFPLKKQQKKLGLIEVYDRNPKRIFTTEDIRLGKALAGQASIAIERIELLRQTQQRLAEVSTLYTLSQQITSTLKLDKLLDIIVTTLRQVVDCRACALFLVNNNNQFLEIKAASGLKARWKENARLQIGEGAAGQAVAQKRTIYIPDTTQDPGYISFDPAVRSLMVVPMITQDQVVGAINLDDTRPNAFGKSQERLLSIAANHAAIAIQSATLFDKVISEEQRTRAIIQHMADGLLMLNKHGQIVKVNYALEMMLRMHSAEIIGQNAYDKHLDPRLAAICAPLTAKERTGVLAHEVTLPGKASTILRIFATTVTDDDGRPIGEVRIVHDVTKERELEKMKDDFLSTISHELRTPLFSIQGFVRLMLDKEAPGLETQREFLSIIERQTGQLTELVSNLLDMNKLSAGLLDVEQSPVQIIDIINQTILKLQGLAHQENVKLTTKLPPSLPITFGDPQRLEQVMTNLAGNAIKFTPAGGRVTIEAAEVAGHILIAVRDTGIGISQKNLDRIFSKFYQVEAASTRSTQGSGLGLHISKQLIEKHNGKIWAESALNKGSVFYIELPIIN